LLLLLFLLLSEAFHVQPSSIIFNKKLSFRPERSAVEKSAFKPTPPTRPSKRTTRTKGLLTAIIVFAALAITPSAHPQGCTQCLDNTAATPPKTQAAYRHAIILLTLAAGGLFITTLALFKRHR
jgi:hypothetical protein